MTFVKGTNNYDKALLLLISSLFAGNMSGVLLLPRTFSFLLLPFLFNSSGNSALPKNPVTLIVVWFLWGCFSLLFTLDRSEGVLQLVLLITNFLLSIEILYFALRSQRPLYFIALGWLISISINNIVGIWEITTDNHLSVSKFGGERELIIGGKAVLMHYANGFFSNYNAFVTFTCCAFPFMYYLLFTAENKLIRCVSFINIFVSIYTIFMDASRGGLLSMFAISVVNMYGIMKYSRSRFKNLFVFGLFVGFVVLSWDSLSALVVGRQSNIGSIEEEARYKVWGRCIKVFVNSYGWGTGVGGLDAAMREIGGKGSVTAPHNAFFEILIQYGIVVFFFFLNYLKGIYLNIKNKMTSPCNVVIYSSLLSMPIIFIINSIYLKNPFFWAFLMSLYVYSDRSCFNYSIEQS